MARAVLLQERLRGDAPGDDGALPVDPGLLERWRRAVEPEGTSWFDKRLQWDGLRLPICLSGRFSPAESGQWADVLRELMQTAPQCTQLEIPATGEPVPFEELLLPAVVVARRRLRQRLCGGRSASPPTDVVTPSAWADLERDLLQRVSWVAEETLEEDFARGAAGRALTAALGFAPADPPGRTRYDAFVRVHLEAGWLTLLERYPVLGRLIASSVALWVDATAELVERLRADRDRLTRAFGIADAARVERVEVGLGDRHRGGRSVTCVVFDDRSRVVYKPRPLAIEARFGDLVDWFDASGAAPALASTPVLDRGDYGWTAYVTDRECRSAAEVGRFYTRAGMLLAVLHLLRATDCHYENLIACGDQPVLVDAETLLYPDPRPLDPAEAPTAPERLSSSVLRVGLLPQWRVHAGAAHDNSGLAAARGPAAPDADTPLAWVDVNTDAMRRVPAEPVPPVRRHIVRLHGRPQSVLDHERQLLDGFRSAYRLLMSRRAELLDPQGPLARMRRCPTRFIFRATRFYGDFLAASRRPDLLRDGIEFGLHLEQLAQAFLSSPTRPDLWPLFSDEVRDVARLDVPLFTTRPDSRALSGRVGRQVDDAFLRPALDVARDQLARFDEDDLARQIRVIKASLAARSGRRRRQPAPPPDEGLPEPMGSADLVAAAVGIGRALEAHAVADGPGSVTWIGLQYLDEGDCHRVDVLNDFLYDGAAGVAVFLGALFRATGDERWYELALRALTGPRQRLRAVEPSARGLACRLRGIGGGSGLGSLLYALTAVAGSLEGTGSTAGLLDDATSLAEWFTPATITADSRLDVLGGSAGAALALLALHRATGDTQALRRAADCGERLLEAPLPARLTGFAHGAAGVAYALFRLSAATGERAFSERAREHLAFERTLFSAEHGNWPDLRPRLSDDGPWPVKWCHGAAGITLSRLGIRRCADAPALRAEIATGLATTRQRYRAGLGSLCCGVMGRVEVFTVAAEVLGDPGLADVARSGAASVLAARARDGDFRLWPGDGLHHPGLFQGTAGIGYQLLRLHDPRLPSVLLWD